MAKELKRIVAYVEPWLAEGVNEISIASNVSQSQLISKAVSRYVSTIVSNAQLTPRNRLIKIMKSYDLYASPHNDDYIAVGDVSYQMKWRIDANASEEQIVKYLEMKHNAALDAIEKNHVGTLSRYELMIPTLIFELKLKGGADDNDNEKA